MAILSRSQETGAFNAAPCPSLAAAGFTIKESLVHWNRVDNALPWARKALTLLLKAYSIIPLNLSWPVV